MTFMSLWICLIYRMIFGQSHWLNTHHSIHGVAHASAVVTFGKKWPFLDSKERSIKEREAFRERRENMLKIPYLLESVSIGVFISGV